MGIIVVYDNHAQVDLFSPQSPDDPEPPVRTLPVGEDQERSSHPSLAAV